MSNVSVYNMEGNEVGTLELNDAVFGVEVNEHLVHMAVVRQLANKRQGTQNYPTDLLGFIAKSICHYLNSRYPRNKAPCNEH